MTEPAHAEADAFATMIYDGFEIALPAADKERLLEDPQCKAAVEDTLRVEQIRHALSLGLPEMAREYPPDPRPMVLACYGPSLADTVHEIALAKAHGAALMTVSGAHDFLIARGIVPDFHAECDPRRHKAKFVANPHPDVTYLIASVCHADLFENLRGHKVELWHSGGSEPERQAIRRPDRDTHYVIAGMTVGTAGMALSMIRGHGVLHIHGMDGCYRGDERHAGAHSGKPQARIRARCGERWFDTSQAMIAGAKDFLWLAPKLTDRLQIFLHGDGLLQEMLKLGTKLGNEEAARPALELNFGRATIIDEGEAVDMLGGLPEPVPIEGGGVALDFV